LADGLSLSGEGGGAGAAAAGLASPSSFDSDTSSDAKHFFEAADICATVAFIIQQS
jgi:hypothetical protein